MATDIAMKIPTFDIHIMVKQDMTFTRIDTTKINASDEVMSACMARGED
jgi:hypothetical protein